MKLEVKASEPTAAARSRLEHFARQEADSLYTLFVRALGDRERAQDLLQETLMEACRHLDRYDSSRPFRAWVFRIGQNRLRNFLRRRRLERKWIRPLEEVPDGKRSSPADGLLERERQELLEKGLLRLPYLQRMAVILRYQEGLSCGEIAALMDTTPNAVSIQLHHARRDLRRLLGEKMAGDSR